VRAARNQIFVLLRRDLDGMNSVRAIRYRRLALAEEDKAKADLLFLSSQMNAIRGFSAPLNGIRPGHPEKMSSRQKQGTPTRGLSGTH